MTEDTVRPSASEPTEGPCPWATSVSYDPVRDEISLTLNRGARLVVARGSIEELRDLPQAHMNDLTLIADGETLASEADDVHIFVPALVHDLVGDYMLKCIPDD